MNKLIVTTAIAAAIGLPSIVAAQTSPLTASIVCRPIAAGETANASIQNAAFLCRPVNMDRIRTAMTDAMTGLGPDQKAKVQAAMDVLRTELQIESHYPGFNGDPND